MWYWVSCCSVFTLVFFLSSLPICGDTRLPAAWDSWRSSHGNYHVLKGQINIPGHLCQSRCLLWPRRLSHSHHTRICWAPISPMSRINAWNTHFCTSAPITTHLNLSSRQAMPNAGDWTDAQMSHTDSQWVKEVIKKGPTAKFLLKSGETMCMARNRTAIVSRQALPDHCERPGEFFLKVNRAWISLFLM